MSGEGQGGPAGGGADEFTSRIQELEERGSAVLVTSDGSRAVHTDACRRLLGAAAGAPRPRLLVSTNGSVDVDSRVPPGSHLDATRVVTTGSPRSAAARAESADDVAVEDIGDASLSDLGVAITIGVDALVEEHGPLDPAELRVGVDSLVPLLDAHGERAVFEFLVYATGYLRTVDALGHVHLPVDREAYVARLLAPLFDAVVEVRVRDGRPQQRWHLDDGAVSSRWLPV